ncbi:type IV-A pilus assembly ATPase PilB [bacterium]|nr:type IV-A pilus assembly ATPase PilB [bacterium]
MKSLLGELLIQAKSITQDQLKQALDEQKKSGGRLAQNLIKLGFIKEKDALFFLSQQQGIPSVDLRNFAIEENVIDLIPYDLAKKYNCIPLNLIGDTLTIAVADPTNCNFIDDLSFLTGLNIETVLTTESLLEDAFRQYYKKTVYDDLNALDFTLEDEISQKEQGKDEITEEDIVDITDFDNIVKGALDNVEVVEDDSSEDTITETDAPIVKLVNGILVKAIKTGASDIHIEPYEMAFRIRLRMDGILRKIMSLPPKIKNAVVSRVKVMSKLDISEKRLPQDGRIKLKLGRNKAMDFRVSTLPTLFGEKVVMRLLDKSNLQLDMTKLGFETDDLEKFQNAIRAPYGMVLVTGPTGSGKTTTLYSALNQLNGEETNIMTAEDPVEFNLPGINQVQVREQIGLTFAAALRSFLRQDPDVIMVGEVRDQETAEIGIKAALTGHMVLSTLHTNDAPGTIIRLVDMGVEPFLVSAAVILVVAQRLARKICPNCKGKIDVPASLLRQAGFSDKDIESGLEIYKGKGCAKCSQTGYKGRVALYEVMTMTDSLKEAIVKGASTEELKSLARKEGMRTLRESGLKKVMEGVTTIEAILGVTV